MADCERLVAQHELKRRFGINYSRVSLWRLERQNRFPRRVSLTKRRIAYIESEILDYIAQLKARRRA
jgi:predicted DNA-binding transcriptional regulator AlpA